MRIAVYNVAAHEGGALTVLNRFYEDVCANEQDIEWLFLTRISFSGSKANVQVKQLRCSSIFDRLLADIVLVPQILKEYKPDAVISLQNTTVFGAEAPQYVFMHQSLQYCPYRFSLLRPEERAIAFRQRFICGSYKHGLKKAKHIFVQTKWIQRATANWCGRKAEDISVVPMQVKDMPDDLWNAQTEKLFFYPARAEMYKNQETLIRACRLLGKEDYKVVLTIDPDATAYGRKLKKEAEGLPIEFAGTLPFEQVCALYAKSVLVFPSYLETCGLPLLEAASVGAPIIAADLPYAHEALDDYDNVQFFEYDNAEALADSMRSVDLKCGTAKKPNIEKGLAEAMLKCIMS